MNCWLQILCSFSMRFLQYFAFCQLRYNLCDNACILNIEVRFCRQEACIEHRLRCGLVDLGHRAGRHSRARALQCIWCSELVTCHWAHVFGACVHWNAYRRDALRSLGLIEASTRSWDIMFSIMRFAHRACVAFVDAVVTSAETFWHTSDTT